MRAIAASATKKDLITLVADESMRCAVAGIVGRPASLGIGTVAYDIFVHPQRDPGVYLRGPDFLRPFGVSYRYALAIFDREGCGRDDPPDQLESVVQDRLDSCGWGRRSAVVVVDPELEVWVWSRSPNIAEPLGWESRTALAGFLRDRSLWPDDNAKPPKPQEAFHCALRERRIPNSSAIFTELAAKVGFATCQDRAFVRLRDTLRQWFPTR